MIDTAENRKFDKMVASHKDAVYRQMVRLCGNRDDAEDVLVETMMKAYRALDQLSEDEKALAWLVQIARRTCFRFRRRDSLLPLLSLDRLHEAGVQWAAPDDSTTQMVLETKRCLMSALEALPEMYRQIYWLRDVEGKSAPEVADITGLGIAAIKSRLHRARAMVRERVDADVLEAC